MSQKLSQASEKQSISFCFCCSVLVLKAQSSVIKKYVTGCRHLVLNSLPSVLFVIGISSPHSWKASCGIAENIMLNRSGVSEQPCFTPFATGKESNSSASSNTFTITPSWNWRTSAKNSLGQPHFSMIFHKSSLLTVLKTFVRFQCICSRTTSGAEATLAFWEMTLSEILKETIKKQEAKTFLAKQRWKMPLWLSQHWRLPFLV